MYKSQQQSDRNEGSRLSLFPDSLRLNFSVTTIFNLTKSQVRAILANSQRSVVIKAVKCDKVRSK